MFAELYTFIEILALLVFGHFIADYPLQGEFLAKTKNHKIPVPGFSPKYHLFVHSYIHGAIVGIITQNIWLGLAELLIHGYIDYAKCDEQINVELDQTYHIVCKIWWAILYTAVLT